MKSLPFLFLLLVFGCSKSDHEKHEFGLSGKLSGLASDSVFLENTFTQEMLSAKVTNGEFLFSGKVDHPESFILYVDSAKEKMVRIFVENSNISIRGSVDSLSNVLITGSKSQDEYSRFQKSIQPIRDNLKVIDGQLNNAMENNLMDLADSLNESYAAEAFARLGAVLEYAQNNTTSSIVPFITFAATMDAPNLEFVEKIFAMCDSTVIRNPRVASFREMLVTLNKIAIGSTVPDFELVLADGRKITPATLKGKVVLIDFWAAWCAPCRKNHPDLVDLYKNYKGDKFELISISLDKDAKSWEAAIKKDGLTWTQYCDFKGAQGKMATDFGIVFIPAGYLIGPDGKVQAKDIHRKKLRERIDELLKAI